MLDLSKLKHVRRTAATGARIIVLDTGAVINAECEAMLQAMQSRSAESVETHLESVAAKGPERFLATYYVGYNHKSIGDCGSVTVFVEDASMPVAKSFQDWFAYCGQEGSTRYMDFSTRTFLNPYGSEEGRAILESSRAFYTTHMDAVIADLIRRFPRQDGEKENVYEKAIKARAFDIMRGFLPAGTSTNFSWHMNLRQAADQLGQLRHHPLPEVRVIADTVEDALKEKYPSSFSHKRYPETQNFYHRYMELEYYLHKGKEYPDFAVDDSKVDYRRLGWFRGILLNRPAHTELPNILEECGVFDLRFTLDWASFRDLQRHRAIHQRMPLLNGDCGFNGWYLKELPGPVLEAAQAHLDNLHRKIRALRGVNDKYPVLDQYYWPMGYLTPNHIVAHIPALVYMVEQRTSRFVHPTLRHRAAQIAAYLRDQLGPCHLKLHLDEDPDRFDVKRGEHDIVVRQ